MSGTRDGGGGGGAGPVDRLTVVGAQHVDGPGLGHRLQGSVDRGEPHPLAGLAQPSMHRLSRGEVVTASEQLGDRNLLSGRPSTG